MRVSDRERFIGNTISGFKIFKNSFIIFIIIYLFFSPFWLIAKEEKNIININEFSDSLKKLGILIDFYGGKPLKLAVLPTENRSKIGLGRLNDDITTMVESSINSIPSENIILLELLVDEKECFFIKGTITKYTEASRIGCFGGGREYIAGTTIAINFEIIDNKTKKPIPNVYTKNSMKIVDLINDIGVGFTINGSGYSINGKASEYDGVSSIIRLLVELSMIELIGKLKKLPYLTAIYGSNIDKKSLEKVKQVFKKLDKKTKIIYIIHLLSHIYNDIDIKNLKTAMLNKKIIQFKKENSLTPYTSKISDKLYSILLKKVLKILIKKEHNMKIKRVFFKVLNY